MSDYQMIENDDIPDILKRIKKSTATPGHPYQVPADYFELLKARLQELVQEFPKNPAPEDELLTAGVRIKGRPFSLPSGYFEAVEQLLLQRIKETGQSPARRIPVWLRITAAAALTGILLLAGFSQFRHSEVRPGSLVYTEDQLQEVKSEELQGFTGEMVPSPQLATRQTRARLQFNGISSSELQHFLEETDLEGAELNPQTDETN
ncbi:hypothetical protein GCM10027051_21720 [Niabella terrae]